MLQQMIQLMSEAHDGQYDKSGKPYFHHPLTVMQLLRSDDIELQIIALGHDLLEDTWVTADYLHSVGYSQRVIDGIVALTKIPGQTYDEYKQRVFVSEDAMRVKLADLEHNMDLSRISLLTENDITRQEKYQLFYSEIIEKLKCLTI